MLFKGMRGAFFTSAMPTLYAVSNWDDHYENNRSRTVKELSWVPVPNSHDGESYSRIITGKNAAEIFAAWILILQVASRCQPRGTLLRSNGHPHDAESLALKTRAPAEWFTKAFEVLCVCGWMNRNSVTVIDTALDRQDDDTAPPLPRHGSVHELNGIERIEIAPKKARARNEILDSLASLETNNLAEETNWGKHAKALAVIQGVTPDVTPDEILRRACNYQVHMKGAVLTSTALASHWGRCGSRATPNGAPSKDRGPTRLPENVIAALAAQKAQA